MRIFVEQLEFIGHHGVFAEERRDGRRFRVDLSVDVDRPDAARSDDLDQTVDYRQLADIVMAVGTDESFQLIERMGHEIVERVFARFSGVERAELTLRKRATGVAGGPRWVGIELERDRH